MTKPQSEVFLRSQIENTLNGLMAAVEHLPAIAGTTEAACYQAGYLTALRAVAQSFNCELRLPRMVEVPPHSLTLIEAAP